MNMNECAAYGDYYYYYPDYSQYYEPEGCYYVDSASGAGEVSCYPADDGQFESPECTVRPYDEPTPCTSVGDSQDFSKRDPIDK